MKKAKCKSSHLHFLLPRALFAISCVLLRVGGDTVLHWIAQQNQTEMATLLLQHGANANEQNKCV
jgi:hypothetical protein